MKALNHTAFFLFGIPILSLFLLTSCEKGTGMSDMSQSDLLKKRKECMRNKTPSPGFAVACENVYREYASRKNKK